MASLYEDTIENVLQIISDFRGESSVNTDDKRIRAISRQERALAKRKLWQLFIMPDQVITGTGASTYTIGTTTTPVRHKGVSEVFVGGTTEDKRRGVVDYHRYKNLYNKDNSTPMAYQWFDAPNKAWKLTINPAPEDGAVITYSYFWIPPVKTLTSDTVFAVDIEALARLALSEIYEGEDEDEKALDQRELAEQLITEAVGYDDSPAVNQLYTMSAIENITVNRGIGTY